MIGSGKTKSDTGAAPLTPYPPGSEQPPDPGSDTASVTWTHGLLFLAYMIFVAIVVSVEPLSVRKLVVLGLPLLLLAAYLLQRRYGGPSKPRVQHPLVISGRLLGTFSSGLESSSSSWWALCFKAGP